TATGAEVVVPDKYSQFEFGGAKELSAAIANALQIKNRPLKTEKQSQHSSLAMLSGFDCENFLSEICFVDNQQDADNYKKYTPELVAAVEGTGWRRWRKRSKIMTGQAKIELILELKNKIGTGLNQAKKQIKESVGELAEKLTNSTFNFEGVNGIDISIGQGNLAYLQQKYGIKYEVVFEGLNTFSEDIKKKGSEIGYCHLIGRSKYLMIEQVKTKLKQLALNYMKIACGKKWSGINKCNDMTPEEFLRDIDTTSQEVEMLISRTLPIKAGEVAVNHFKENFNKSGFVNNGVQKWLPSKRLTGKYGDKKNGTLLSERKNLQSDIEKVTGDAEVTITTTYQTEDYAKVHNEGLRSGRGKGFQMPKRQFMGDSAELDEKIQELIEDEVSKIFKL
ncbi:MAG: phage virion morphogenesis protein, partial [Prevotellaceae bacterium]|nr:phage virion morphogenesis protein [Prevotellaceae bacterium]